MHGRIKVRTTAEQEEAKQKERAKKLKLYIAGTQRIFEKREKKEYDQEALDLTETILIANSDFTTFWNFRKEIFQEFRKIKSEEELQPLCDNELKFLESCLRFNPKSYSVWNHRGFVMEQMSNPNWKREMVLCNKFLEYDERNFHCWDYRRHVVGKAKISAEEELEFSTAKISSNFSNYSSWHYRSKLLPLIHPDPNDKDKIKEDVLLKEHEMAQNAFFTDPNDQSAWFYHRWLLGRVDKKLDIRCMYLNLTSGLMVVTFTQPMCFNDNQCQANILCDGNKLDGLWKTPLMREKQNCFSVLWTYLFDVGSLPSTNGGHLFELSLPDSKIKKTCTVKTGACEGWNLGEVNSPRLFMAELSAATSDVITAELESCRQLQELEPDNKWCLLTIVLLMRATDPIGYREETKQYLGLIEKIDDCRRTYYRDVQSKHALQNSIIEHSWEEGSSDRSIDLSKKSLTVLYHLDHLVLATRVDLSCNHLKTLNHCSMLQCVRVLVADDNCITDIHGVCCLPALQQLSLKNNNINNQDQLIPLKSCPKLVQIYLIGNPICNQIMNDPSIQSRFKFELVCI